MILLNPKLFDTDVGQAPIRAGFESGRSNPTFSFIQKVTAGLGLRLAVK